VFFLLTRLVRKNALCAVDGALALLLHYPTAPNEQNRALPWLITGQIIKKLLDTFFPNKKGLTKP
jgi:hypothetical protein